MVRVGVVVRVRVGVVFESNYNQDIVVRVMSMRDCMCPYICACVCAFVCICV